ncbi:MAG: head GIN domain-containing protein [Cypionkella sp.]
MVLRLLKGFAPIAALGAALLAAGCDANITINGDEGVPLSELRTAGETPTQIVLAGPDSVVVERGEALKIETSGDPAAVAALRFSLKNDTLAISRAKGEVEGDGTARVAVTLPMLEKIVVAGSGTLEAPGLADQAEVTIAGSGTAVTRAIDAQSLAVTVAGSGTYRASGRTPKLDLTIAGSGTADMSGLHADAAEVTVAGSGNARFASDGTVEAVVMGSGDVTVAGRAKCTIKSMGSGSLRCAAGTPAAGASDPPASGTPSAPRE